MHLDFVRQILDVLADVVELAHVLPGGAVQRLRQGPSLNGRQGFLPPLQGQAGLGLCFLGMEFRKATLQHVFHLHTAP